MRCIFVMAMVCGGTMALGQTAAQPKPAAPAATPAAAPAPAPASAPAPAPGPAAGTDDWRTAEADTLKDYVQLTTPDKFVKAGEAYFSPDDKWIIFQAVPVPAAGQEASPFYAMYLAKLKYNDEPRIVGMEEPVCISPPGSANTCGFFNPKKPFQVIFGSTMTAPKESAPAGYQRGTSSYRWAFPTEMDVVARYVNELAPQIRAPGSAQQPKFTAEQTEPKPMFPKPGYDAECSFDPTGRYIVFASSQIDPKAPPADGVRPNITIDLYDTARNRMQQLVSNSGYNGGPFFSPDGKYLCYRSDRKGDDLLQVYIAELNIDDESGMILAIKEERPVTADNNVNWAPFWHPSSQYLIYASSAVGHDNYEVFSVQAPVDSLATAKPEQLIRKRITYAAGFDGLPVFSRYAEYMMWTSQRGGKREGEQKASSQLWVARTKNVDPSPPAATTNHK